MGLFSEAPAGPVAAGYLNSWQLWTLLHGTGGGGAARAEVGTLLLYRKQHLPTEGL